MLQHPGTDTGLRPVPPHRSCRVHATPTPESGSAGNTLATSFAPDHLPELTIDRVE